jgi:ornithine--oxo-acid transaminase
MCITIDNADGAWVFDETGKRYLDCQTAFTADHFGHNHPRINEAILKQAKKITEVPNVRSSEHYKPLVNELCRLSGFDTALLVGSINGAIKSAIDIAYNWGQIVKGVNKERAEIILCHSHIHHLLELKLDDNQDEQTFSKYNRVAINDVDNLEQVLTIDSVTLILEPIQVLPEVTISTSDYLHAVRDFCKEHNLLFIMDETLTGLGRTGTLFIHETVGIRPDLLLLGNTLTGGTYPLAAILSVYNVIDQFSQTNYENLDNPDCFPMAGSAARAAIQLLVEDNLVERSRKMGAYFLKRLNQLHCSSIEAIFGQGLFLVVEFYKDIKTQRIKEALMRQGILCRQVGDHAIALSPPLIITEEEIDWGVDRMNVVFTLMEH